MLGKYEEAISDFEKAIELNPQDKEAKSLREEASRAISKE
jgi:Flp pilus assembly protein TadD